MATLELNGTTYTLAYKPWRVIKRLAHEQQLNLLDMVEQSAEAWATAMTNPDTLSAMLWGGLIHAKPELTIADVDELFGPGDIVEVGRAITAAVGEAFQRTAVAPNPTT